MQPQRHCPRPFVLLPLDDGLADPEWTLDGEYYLVAVCLNRNSVVHPAGRDLELMGLFVGHIAAHGHGEAAQGEGGNQGGEPHFHTVLRSCFSGLAGLASVISPRSEDPSSCAFYGSPVLRIAWAVLAVFRGMSMLSLRRPTAGTIQAFLTAQARLDLTYSAVGATATIPPAGYVVDHTR